MDELAKVLASEIAMKIKNAAASERKLSIALSGGSTPKLLFSVLAGLYSETIKWDDVHFYWGDERCVPPYDQESNYGEAKKILFDRINIPGKNIHRIMGENEPSAEAIRYSLEVRNGLDQKNGWPVFDLMILGMGEDGHIASIFPGLEDLFNSDKICEVAVHPVSGQNRITITGKVINNSGRIIFLVSGKNKAGILSAIMGEDQSKLYPASLVKPTWGKISWYIDREAGGNLLE